MGGNPIRFDPKPVVFHRRRGRDVDKLAAAYDRGRGTHYANYILRSGTRKDYIYGWWRLSNTGYYWSSLVRLSRELTAAIAYLVHCRRYGFLFAAAPVGLAAHSTVGVLVMLRFGVSRVSSYTAGFLARLWPATQRSRLH